MSSPVTHTDATPSLLDDETLNESERALIEHFERTRQPVNGQEGANDGLTSAEDLQEPGTPGASTSSAAPVESTPVEGQVDSTESDPSSPSTESTATEDESGFTAAPVEGEPTGGEPAQSASAFTFAGVTYQPQELQEAVMARDWIMGLNPVQRQQIDALLSGQYVLAPAHEASSTTPPSGDAVPPATTPSSSTPPDDEGEWLDPKAAQEIARLRSELSQIKEQFTQSLTPVVQAQQQDELRQRNEIINASVAKFQADTKLDDDTLRQLNDAVVQSGIFPSLVQRHNGDISTATRAAFEMMLWSTPQFRDKVIAQQAVATVNDLAQTQRESADKERKMSALSGSGGSVPRREVPAHPQTADGRHAAMLEEIRRDMNGQ
jgi:superfamily II RNA helicase